MAERASTLQNVAEAAGVSRSAAGRVLLGSGGSHVRVSEDTRKRILAAAQKLNYTPNRFAQQLRGISTNTLGILVRSNNTPVMSERLFALEREAAQRGYRLLVGNVTADDALLEDYVNDFGSRAVDAIFCLFDLTPERDQLVRRAFRSFRKVLFHGRAAWRGGYCVRLDTAEAITRSVAHVVACGKRRPTLALWNRNGDELMEVRCKAFTDALAAHGIVAATPSMGIWDAQSPTVIPERGLLDRGIEHILKSHKADAILASNDLWAVRIIQKLKEGGIRVPEDVAVVGHDNLDIGTVIEPQLTTVDPVHSAYAAAAMDLLLRISNEEKIASAERTVTVQPNLILRDSA